MGNVRLSQFSGINWLTGESTKASYRHVEADLAMKTKALARS